MNGKLAPYDWEDFGALDVVFVDRRGGQIKPFGVAIIPSGLLAATGLTNHGGDGPFEGKPGPVHSPALSLALKKTVQRRGPTNWGDTSGA